MIWKQFTHLDNFPPELKSRFNSFLTTEFDDSLSVEMQFRSIIKWCQGNFKTVDTLIDFINDISNWLKQFENTFGTKLEERVISVLSEWQVNGKLDVVINEALQWQLDDYIVTNEQDKLSLTAQLQHTANKLFDVVNVKEYDDLVIRDELGNRVDWSPAYEAAFNSGASKVIFPNWTMTHKNPVVVPDSVKTIDFSRAKIQYEKEQSKNDYSESSFVVIGVDDLTITGGVHEYVGTFDYGSYSGYISAIYAEECNNLTIKNLEASGFNRSGINIASGDDFSTYCENPKIINCNLHHNRVSGLIFGNTEGIEVAGCRLEYNGLLGDIGTGYGCTGWSSKNPKNSFIHHNHASYNHRKGIDFHGGIDGIIDHNICIGNTYYGIFIGVGAKEVGKWLITQNQIRDMSNDGSIPSQETLGISVGTYEGQGIGLPPSTFIISGNIISNLTKTGSGLVYPIMMYCDGLSYGTIHVKDNDIDVGVISRFLHTSANSTNRGNYHDVYITGNKFCAQKLVDQAFTLNSTLNRMKRFSGNTVEIKELYNKNIVFTYASTTVVGNTMLYENNEMFLNSSLDWEYDPLVIRRYAREKSTGNMLNSVPHREWDGYKFIGWGSAPPTTGYWSRGSIIENTNPAANGFMGWVCTIAGLDTNSVWQTYGSVTAE